MKYKIINDNKFITRDYLERLDNELEMIPVTFDPVFKSVFSSNINLLKRFLNVVLELDLDIDEMEIKLLNSELPRENIYIDQDKIVLKFLEYYRKLYYTDKNELDEAGIWLAGLTSTTFSELYDIFSNILDGNELNVFIGDVIKMSKDYFSIHEWEKEKMDALVKYNYYKDGKDEGFYDGLEEGIQENTLNMTKEMIKNNASIEFISKVTKLSQEEIKEIEESMKD